MPPSNFVAHMRVDEIQLKVAGIKASENPRGPERHDSHIDRYKYHDEHHDEQKKAAQESYT